ncbi:MAG: hypothetical protein R3F55_14010 [Alphaproteobacteria bacterium]
MGRQDGGTGRRGATRAVMLAAGAVALAGCVGGQGRATGERAAAFPFETAHECNTAVAAALDRVGVGPDRIAKLWYDDQIGRDVDGDSRIVGYTVWARVAEGPGYLIVDLTPQCFVRQVYTRGGLELPGLPAF